jgi:hypothetical protein
VLHFSIDELKPWAILEGSILVRELEALQGTLRALIATLMPQSA